MKDFILEYSIPDTNLFKDKVESHMEDLIRDFNRGIIYTYYVLGRYNFECKRDYKYSEQLLKEGSKRGLDLCMLYLAKMYEVNAIKTNNKDRDIYYCYENAAKKGNVEAKEWIETHFYDNDTKKILTKKNHNFNIEKQQNFTCSDSLRNDNSKDMPRETKKINQKNVDKIKTGNQNTESVVTRDNTKKDLNYYNNSIQKNKSPQLDEQHPKTNIKNISDDIQNLDKIEQFAEDYLKNYCGKTLYHKDYGKGKIVEFDKVSIHRCKTNILVKFENESENKEFKMSSIGGPFLSFNDIFTQKPIEECNYYEKELMNESEHYKNTQKICVEISEKEVFFEEVGKTFNDRSTYYNEAQIRDRDTIAQQTHRSNWLAIRDEPYFGSVSYLNNCFYIGKKAIPEANVLVWTNPKCEIFYSMENAVDSNPNLLYVRHHLSTPFQYIRFVDSYNAKEIDNIQLRNDIANKVRFEQIQKQRSSKKVHDIIETIFNEQYSVIRADPKHNILVEGTAGSGKTSVIFHRIQWWVSNFEEYRDYKICVLSPNVAAKNDASSLIKKLDLKNVDTFAISNYYIDSFLKTLKYHRSSLFFKNKSLDNNLKLLDECKISKVRDELIVGFYNGSVYEIAKELIKDYTQRISRIFIGNEGSVLKKFYDNVNDFSNETSIRDSIKGLIDNNYFYYNDYHSNEVLPFQKHFNENVYLVKRILLLLKDINKENIAEYYNSDVFFKNNPDRETRDYISKCFAKMIELFSEKMKHNPKMVIEKETNKLVVSKHPDEIRDIVTCFKSAKRSNSTSQIDNNVVGPSIIIDAFDYYIISKVLLSLSIFSDKETIFGLLANYYYSKEFGVRFNVYYDTIETSRAFALLYLFSSFGYLNNNNGYNWVYIDEYQNLSKMEFLVIKALNKTATLSLFGDKKQKLDQKGIENPNQVLEFEEFKLKSNVRNAKQICEVINDMLGMKMIPSGISGKVYITNKIDKFECFNNDRCAVITKDITTYEKYGLTKLEDTQYTINNGKVYLLPVEECKGLEFEKVYVDLNNMSINEKYVAMSRALCELIILNN